MTAFTQLLQPGDSIVVSAAAAPAPATPPPPTVTPVLANLTPDEPSGLALVTSYDFPDAIPVTDSEVTLSDAWHSIYNGRGLVSKFADATDPISPPNVGRFAYPTGFAGGVAPGTLARSLPALSRVYCAFSVKTSNPWQGHQSGVNKLGFFFQNAGECPILFYGPPGGPFQLQLEPHELAGAPLADAQLVPNVANKPFLIGAWHVIEWLIDLKVGQIAWALDGTVIGNYTGLALGTAPFIEYHLSPTWGGVGDAKTEDDWLEFGHILISGA